MCACGELKLKAIRVLVVDDSELIRQVLTEVISQAPDLEVVGAAEDPLVAREMIKQLNPDVLTLDVEMPKMDGISFLRNLMRLRPMPVVMISTLTEKGAPVTLDALEIGAVDYIAKPQGGSWQNLKAYAAVIQQKVRDAASANMMAHDRATKPEVMQPGAIRQCFKPGRVICIGSSTGGTEAIKVVLKGMPQNCPPIVIAQHIPPVFSATLATRLNNLCGITVREAKSGMPLESGNAYLAPGDFHLKLRNKGGQLVTLITEGERVNGHMPSVEVLFKSVLEHAGNKTVAALLTGMGSDGAQGLKEICESGGCTIAQDQDSSVVWGMPGSAVKLNAAQQVLSIEKIGKGLLKACL